MTDQYQQPPNPPVTQKPERTPAERRHTALTLLIQLVCGLVAVLIIYYLLGVVWGTISTGLLITGLIRGTIGV